jgi:hypothetical protein
MVCLRLALVLVALLALGAAPAGAATLNVESPLDPRDDQLGNARCDPLCGTISQALERANALPGLDVIGLQRGTYREDLAIRSNDDLIIAGLGGATIIRGRFAVEPARAVEHADGSVSIFPYERERTTTLLNLTVAPSNRIIAVTEANLVLNEASVNGRVLVTRGALDGVDATIAAASSCDKAVTVTGQALEGLFPEEVVDNGRLERTMLLGSLRVADGARYGVSRSWVIGNGAGCGALWAVGVTGEAAITVDNALITASKTGGVLGQAGGAPNRHGLFVNNATALVRLSTIGGGFDYGVSAENLAYVDLRGVAIDGSTVAIDARRRAMAIDLHDVRGSGPALLCRRFDADCFEAGAVGLGAAEPGQDWRNGVFGPTAVPLTGGGPLAYYPGVGSPLVNAATAPWPGYPLGDDGDRDIGGRARPVWFFDIGAWETAAAGEVGSPPPPRDAVGPGWAGIDLTPQGGIVVDFDGLGLPARAGAGEAGSEQAAPAALDGSGGAVATAAADRSPRLEVRVRRTTTQGSILRIRVKTPWLGRLAVRVYGARGGLINVGRARPVNRGWRVVKVQLGPNARVGTARILVTHRRPAKPLLTAVATVGIAKRPRS